jgi:response regulator RpfG family c-di-GMP phosphodiesterase
MDKKPKVLIVDDVAENLHLLTRMLKKDYTIIATTKPNKVLELAQKNPKPDIILLDVIMPEIDGYELCQALKKNPETANIPVLFITSLNSVEDQEKGLEVGGVDFIAKPFSRKIVIQKIETQLQVKTLQPILENRSEIDDNDNNKDTILVVDDAPENISLIVEILKQDYKVSVATSGEKSLELLNNGLVPNIILLDVVMPNFDGFEICKKIKSMPKHKDIPIIFLTILEDKKDVIKGLELGAVDYVSKPVEPSVLKARVQTHLKLKHYQDKLKSDIKLKNEILIKQSKLATLGEMFENITHQWKQPLSVISMSSGHIRIKQDLGNLDSQVLAHSLDNIENSTKYLNQTVEVFRDFLKDDVQKQYFNINELISNTLKIVHSKFSNIDIEVSNHVEDFEIYTLKNNLVQVLMNILSNAEDVLKNKDGNRNINISSTTNENQFILKIDDNGGGVDESLIDTIFDKHVTSKDDGTGIGLYMSKKLIQERLGGEIRCYNNKDGACFEITLPIK